jgi:hypothetical protein
MKQEATQIVELNLAVPMPNQGAAAVASPLNVMQPPASVGAAGGSLTATPAPGQSVFSQAQTFKDLTQFNTTTATMTSTGIGGNSRRTKFILAMIGLGILLGGVFYVFSEDFSLESLWSFNGEEASDEPPAAQPKKAKKKVEVVQTVESPTPQPIQPNSNIWASLGNELAGPVKDPERSLTQDELHSFREKLESDVTYQRYLAAYELGKLHASGGEDLLHQLIQDPKLWTRMRAVIALADLGEEISEEEFKTAVGQERTDLYIGFFKRFEKSEPCSEGCYFVARQAMRYLPARARASVLNLISIEQSSIGKRFVDAAKQDSEMGKYIYQN